MERLNSILIIDDESDIRLVVKSILNKEAYNDVDEAENGEEAVELIEKKKYDLIICDIKMEKMDGIQFLHNLRQRNNVTWFLFLTGYLDEKAMRSGTFLYIEKPFNKANLLFTVRRVELLRSLFIEYDEILKKVDTNMAAIQDNLDDKELINGKINEVKSMIEKKSDYIYSLYFNDEVKIVSV